MRFQGENCTLSFSLHFDKGQVLLSGTIWPRQHRSLPAQQPTRLRFTTLLPEADVANLQHWLATGTPEPIPLPDPIRQARRIMTHTDDIVHLELDYHLDPLPTWWEWEVTNPLKIRLDIRPNEFTYLTKSLSRENWPNDLTW
ncbi:hypothetical protein ACFSUS_01725 [Spirosoma soli]|uniref:Uncharacterized protein n=1 Tax=Spirosoma soli TaxID=1770529 RepID=A0ABW5M131_9BACT